MKAETKKQISEAKKILKADGRKLKGFLFVDGYGEYDEFKANSGKVIFAIEAAEEAGSGIKSIFANCNDQIVIKS